MEIREKELQLAISRFQQKVYAFVLSLIQGNPDEAYRVTVSGFNAEIGSVGKDDFLTRVLAVVLAACREVKVMPIFDDLDLEDVKLQEKQSLGIIREALGKLLFDERALLLLRDQLNLSYRQIGEILNLSEKKIKTNFFSTRMKLRENIDEILKGKR